MIYTDIDGEEYVIAALRGIPVYCVGREYKESVSALNVTSYDIRVAQYMAWVRCVTLYGINDYNGADKKYYTVVVKQNNATARRMGFITDAEVVEYFEYIEAQGSCYGLFPANDCNY